MLATVVGDVTAPGVFEVPMGTRLSALIERAGGLRPGRSFKAAFPGVAGAVLAAGDVNIPLTYEDFEEIGSGLGAGGLVVYDDSACMVEVSALISRFLYVESCGQCLPCKLGTGQITGAIDRIRDGTGSDQDLDLIQERLRVVTDGNRCYLPVQERAVVSSVLRSFPGDFADHLDGWCPSERTGYVLPKLVDLDAGTGELRHRPGAQAARLDVLLARPTSAAAPPEQDAGVADVSLAMGGGRPRRRRR